MWVGQHLRNGEDSVWLERLEDLLQCRLPVHDLAQDRNEQRAVERVGLHEAIAGIPKHQLNIGHGFLRNPSPELAQHGLLEIEGDHAPAHADPPRGRHRHAPGAATHIEDHVARSNVSPIEEHSASSHGFEVGVLEENG